MTYLSKNLVLPPKYIIFALDQERLSDISRILSIGKLIKFKQIPRQALIIDGGPRPSGYA